jgi:hypothetical protein
MEERSEPFILRRPLSGEAAFDEVAIQRLGRRCLLRQRHVGIGPHQKERAPGDAGVAVSGRPDKSVQGQPARRAPPEQIRVRLAVDMGLPDGLRQKLVIVDTIRRDPRQTVAAVNAAGLSCAQRTTAIIHVDLGHCPKSELARRLEGEDARQRRGRKPQADEIGEAALRGCERKGLVGRRNRRRAKPIRSLS